MNRIQSLSRNIQTEQLKQRLGIDPAADIDGDTVRRLWSERRLAQLKSNIGARFSPGLAANDD